MNYKFYGIAIFFLALTSCSSTQYFSDSLTEVDPSIYTSYSLEDNCADDINPIMQLRIKNALEQNFRSHNYTKERNGDVLIKYFVKNISKKYIEECRDEYRRWEGGRICQEKVINYVEGSIVVDIIDTNTNSIIWHGAAHGPKWSSIRNPNEKVAQVIETLLSKYFDS